MKNLIIIISIIFTGCADKLSPKASQAETHPYRLINQGLIPPTPSSINPAQFLTSANNKWVDPSTWGSPGAINITETRTLAEHPDVHQIFKDQMPIFCEEFVLWRVTHDGSCWVDVGVILAIDHLIRQDEVTFDKAIALFKEIFAIKNENYPAEDAEIIKDFFDVLDLVRAKRDPRYCFHFISHRNVRDALMKGFRKLLSNWHFQEGNVKEATKAATLEAWGHPNNFRPLFFKFDLAHADIDTNGSLRPEYIEPTSISLSSAFASNDDIFGSDPAIRKVIEQLPDIIAFNTRPGYGDVIVKKSFAEAVR
jgi:hypothetical protein